MRIIACDEFEQPNIELSCPAERSQVSQFNGVQLALSDGLQGDNSNDLLGGNRFHA